MTKSKVRSLVFKICCYIFLGLVLIFVLAPIMATILFSFNSGRFATLPLRGFTLDWYKQALSNEDILLSLKNSVLIGLTSSAISAALGFMASYGLRHWESKMKNVFTLFSLSAMAIPWTILGLALLIYFKGIGVHLSNVTVCISHVVFTCPLALTTINARMQTIPMSYEDAAHDLGAGSIRTLLFVMLPQAFPAILSAMLLCFTLSFDEFIISWFVCGFDTTLPVYLYNVIRAGAKPTVNAIGSVVFGISILFGVISQLLVRKKK